MSLILVVEAEGRYVERIRDALTSEGWRTRAVGQRSEALQAAASEAPNLVLVSTGVDGASALIDAFARRNGGPGVVAVVEEAAAGGASAEGVGADDLLTKPFTDQDLRLTVRRGLAAATRPASPRPAAAGGGDGKLTSAEIFGDLVAEVEGELARAEAEGTAGDVPAAPAAGRGLRFEGAPTIPIPVVTGLRGGARPGTAGSGSEAAASATERSGSAAGAAKGPPPAAAAPAAPAAARRDGDDDEMERRLEQTLSGVLDRPRAPAAAGRRGEPEPRPATPPAAPQPAAPRPEASRPAAPQPAASRPAQSQPAAAFGAAAAAAGGARAPRERRGAGDDIDDLDALLSGRLEGLDLEGRRPRRRPPARPAPAEEDPLAGLDLSALEEIARPRRPPAAPAAEPAGAGAPGPGPAPAEAAVEAPVELELVEEAAPEEAAAAASAPAAEPTPAPARAAPATSPEQGERFGQYTLLERIAVGGMAEVWKARMRGVEGFQKTVAIKKILPHLTDNAEFVSMFIDEAKLAAQLSHPNIIHIYDLGKIGESYYIAMEYVEGRNLRNLLDAARKRERPMPHGLALLIAARLASALDYAHRKRDFDNRELGLVHRDVSPQNVLISFDGDIKLCDFGIAKAVAKASHTQMGALKGKLQYMSPEQAWGRTVDARSDIFSLGSLLFEMMTGRRLFSGDSEISVLEAVRECDVEEPRSLEPSIPAGANDLVMKALAKEPDQRYESAGDFQNALEKLLYTLKPTPGPADLTAYLEELSGARPPATAAAVPPAPPEEAAAAAPAAEPEEPEEAAAAAGPARGGAAAESAPALAASPATAPPAGDRPVSGAHATAGSAVVAPAAGRRPGVEEGTGPGRWLLIAAIVVAVALGLVAFFVLRPGAGTPDPAPPGDEVPVEPAAEEPPPLLEDALPEEAGADGEAPATEPGDAAPGAAAGGTGGPAAESTPIEELVEERLAAREEAIRSEREAELRRLEQELAARREAEAAAAEPPAADAEPEVRPEDSRAPEPAAPPSAEPAAAAATGVDEQRAAGEPAAAAPAAAPPVEPADRPAGTEPAPATTGVPAAAAPQRPPESAAGSQTSGVEAPGRADRQPPPATARSEPEPPPSVRVGDLVEFGPGVVPPKLVSIDKPEYPPIARRMQVEGEVLLSVLVDENGKVLDVRFIERVRQAVGINEAAVEAARSARYQPATKDGVRVKMWTHLRLPFRL